VDSRQITRPDDGLQTLRETRAVNMAVIWDVKEKVLNPCGNTVLVVKYLRVTVQDYLLFGVTSVTIRFFYRHCGGYQGVTHKIHLITEK